jgi:carbon storage regulator
MLVLSRKTDETIVIDGRIEVTVVQIEGGRVRLGITAPREVSIRRSELAPRHETEPRHQTEVGAQMGEALLATH